MFFVQCAEALVACAGALFGLSLVATSFSRHDAPGGVRWMGLAFVAVSVVAFWPLLSFS
ncbi:MAG: hypothetical protein M3Q60_22385 [Actinomycetota bacterium]|jgi:hypothetical protein|nr:hypothetical protein [Actinomycetota bacterium]